ncbi:capsule assembly Wzi family protein [Runella limosa]|uniref:capsule assembly Wzi family protein n=1 Tax=Runella limosa TaxID=370978 RepID=UPI00041ECC5F|nr:capsule assembly Wzi family protein [Runella limosa]
MYIKDIPLFLYIRYVITLFLCLVFSVDGNAQKDTTNTKRSFFYGELITTASTGTTTPFWIKSNQYGSIPDTSFAGLIKTGTHIRFGKGWQINAEGIINTLAIASSQVPVFNGTFQNKYLDIYIGRRKEVFGIGDTLAGAGSFIWSGNALPIPKIHLGTNGFISPKFLGGAVALQATIAHGWFGKGKFASGYYLHQKSILLRIGKVHNRFALYGGFFHFAQWGGKAPLLIGLNRTQPDGSLPHSLRDFGYVFIAKNTPKIPNISSYDSVNRIGNHLGVLNLGLQWQTAHHKLLLYYQRPAETEAVFKYNLPDGQYGISWTNKRTSKQLKFDQISLEYLSTLRQNLRLTPQWGYLNDDYFNNSQYMDGWTYQGQVIGTPFMSLRDATQARWFDVKGKYENRNYQQINGNSFQVYYLGARISYRRQNILQIKISHTRQSLYQNTDGSYQQVIPQTSMYVTFERKMRSNAAINLKLARDTGDWLPNTHGVYLSYFKQITF